MLFHFSLLLKLLATFVIIFFARQHHLCLEEAEYFAVKLQLRELSLYIVLR